MTDVADQRRRRLVVAMTFVVGSSLLLAALREPPGSSAFYPLTFGLAAVLAAGGLLAGPVPLGDRDLERQVLRPAVLAGGLFLVFLVARFAVMLVPAADDALRDVLRISDDGNRPLVLAAALATAVAEEMFFRGAVYDASRQAPVITTTASYVVMTAFTANLLLVAAAAVLGVVTARQRQVTGGVAAPAVTHVVWSVLMIALLPR